MGYVAVFCSGSSHLYSVTALDLCLHNTSALSAESNRFIHGTLPSWNIGTERYSLAAGIAVLTHKHPYRMAFYATGSQQGNPEVTDLEIGPSHHLTCHRGSPAPHGSPDHSPNFPFGTRLWDFPRAHHTCLGSNGFQPSSLFMEMCSESCRSEHRHSLGTWQVG